MDDWGTLYYKAVAIADSLGYFEPEQIMYDWSSKKLQAFIKEHEKKGD